MRVANRWLVARPAAALAGLVEQYVGYRLEGCGAGVHRGLPSRHLTFIVAIGQAIDVVAQTDPRQAPASYGCVVGGLQATPALIAYDGRQEGVAVALSPLGARALLGLPAGALWNLSLELDELIGAAGHELWARLQATASWEQRFAVCDELLCRILRDDRVEPALARSWQLVACGDDRSIDEIARTVGFTRQHFARRFRAEFGLAPKLAARVARFDRARRMLESISARAPIAEVAAACGYYDQAHLTHDFVELAGCPPGRLLAAEELPILQDTITGGRR